LAARDFDYVAPGGRRLGSVYRADFLCYDRVVVEIKALHRTSTRDDAQVINYLAATRLRVGLLINFGGSSLVHHRFAADSFC
jgi:GxxExxY protein